MLGSGIGNWNLREKYSNISIITDFLSIFLKHFCSSHNIPSLLSPASSQLYLTLSSLLPMFGFNCFNGKGGKSISWLGRSKLPLGRTGQFFSAHLVLHRSQQVTECLYLQCKLITRAPSHTSNRWYDQKLTLHEENEKGILSILPRESLRTVWEGRIFHPVMFTEV